MLDRNRDLMVFQTTIHSVLAAWAYSLMLLVESCEKRVALEVDYDRREALEVSCDRRMALEGSCEKRVKFETDF